MIQLPTIIITFMSIVFLMFSFNFFKGCSKDRKAQSVFKEQKEINKDFLERRVEKGRREADDLIEIQKELNKKNESREETLIFLKYFK